MDAHMSGREFVLTRNTQPAPEAQTALRAGRLGGAPILPAVQWHGVDPV